MGVSKPEFPSSLASQTSAARMFSAPIGAISPLWFAFAGAASAGVCYWWMTRWMRPSHLEAVQSAHAVPATHKVEPEPISAAPAVIVEKAEPDVTPLTVQTSGPPEAHQAERSPEVAAPAPAIPDSTLASHAAPLEAEAVSAPVAKAAAAATSKPKVKSPKAAAPPKPAPPKASAAKVSAPIVAAPTARVAATRRKPRKIVPAAPQA